MVLPGAAIWLLCGTAPSQLESIGPLLLGRRNWHVAWRQSEWTGPGCPSLSRFGKKGHLWGAGRASQVFADSQISSIRFGGRDSPG